MRICRRCYRAWEKDALHCPHDGAKTRAPDDRELRHKALLGTQVEKYRIEGIVGVGGMGAVFRAVHVGLDKPVAIKVIHGHVAQNKEMVARFLREARRLAQLRDAYFVNVSDNGTLADGRHFFVMDLLFGEPLTNLVERAAPMTELRTAAIASEIALGLAAAHEANVFHRDLKPDNVFLVTAAPGDSEWVQLKILDFGIARTVDTKQTAGCVVSPFGSLDRNQGTRGQRTAPGWQSLLDRTGYVAAFIGLLSCDSIARWVAVSQTGCADHRDSTAEPLRVRSDCDQPRQARPSGPRHPSGGWCALACRDYACQCCNSVSYLGLCA